MPSAEKYVVLHRGCAITTRARRADAHAVKNRLGDEYTVWNHATRRISA